jgi:hypothetical protein
MYLFLKNMAPSDSIDICDENDSCPIFPGRQVLEIRLDPSSVFLAMLRLMLHDDKVGRIILILLFKCFNF